MRKLIAVLFVLSLGACQSITPPQPYIHADRMTKSAVEPMLNTTAQDHPDMKPAIDDLLQSWELRLKTAETGE